MPTEDDSTETRTDSEEGSPVSQDDVTLTTDDEAQRDDLPVRPTNS